MKPEITSLANPLVKKVCAYQKKRKERDRDGVFVAEGERLVTEAPAGRIAALYVTASWHRKASGHAKRFLASLDKITHPVSDEVFAKMSDTKTPQGILAVVKREVPGQIFPEKGPVLLLEDVQDPGNLGTILRTAEAAGTAGVFLCGRTADLYSPKAVRATMGSIFRIPVITDSPEDGIPARIKKLQADGFCVAAADAKGEVDYDAYDWTRPTALVIGNEANGISGDTKRLADVMLRIPMAGSNESLNAAVASAVMMFEAARQRREAPGKPGKG